MVDEERSQLGVLMALGYSKSAIMGKYLIYSGSATVIGCAIGIIGASYLFPQILWQAYSIMYSFTDKLVFYIDPALSIGTFVAYVAVMLFVTWYSCKSELSETPANIIRPKPPKSGKRVLLERIPIIWNHLSFMWKVTMRNIFRYKQRVLMMILGIGGCTALMITGFGIQDSISDIVSYQYRDITMYDYDVTFSDPLTESDMAEFTDSVSQYTGETLFVYQKSMTVMADKAEKAAYVTVVPESDRIESFMDFHKNSTHLDFPSDGEALINSGLADILGVKAGDTITVVGNENENMRLTVSGVFDNYIYNYVYITGETYEKLTGETPEIKTACIIGNDGEDASLVTAKLLNEKGVITVSSSTAMAERINNMMKNLVYIVILTIVCAAALAFIVIYNLTNINITERMREIATVKVLGFYNWESATYVLRENILLTILGALLGIPLGIALNAFVITKINIDLISFEPVIMPTSYLYSIMFTFLFSILVDIVMYKKIKQNKLRRSLESRRVRSEAIVYDWIYILRYLTTPLITSYHPSQSCLRQSSSPRRGAERFC
jgi:putative ABC transport system permease protein